MPERKVFAGIFERKYKCTPQDILAHAEVQKSLSAWCTANRVEFEDDDFIDMAAAIGDAGSAFMAFQSALTPQTLQKQLKRIATSARRLEALLFPDPDRSEHAREAALRVQVVAIEADGGDEERPFDSASLALFNQFRHVLTAIPLLSNRAAKVPISTGRARNTLIHLLRGLEPVCERHGLPKRFSSAGEKSSRLGELAFALSPLLPRDARPQSVSGLIDLMRYSKTPRRQRKPTKGVQARA